MSVLTLPAVKTYLNIVGTQDDGELPGFMATAERLIAERVGPLEATSVEARVVPVGTRLRLPVAPILSLTSVTPSDGGSALTVSDLHHEGAVVTFNSGERFVSRYYDVDYQAGRAVCPPDLLMATMEQVRHMWLTQRGSGVRPGGPKSDTASNTLPGAGYTLSFAVLEKIAPHEQRGGAGFA